MSTKRNVPAPDKEAPQTKRKAPRTRPAARKRATTQPEAPNTGGEQLTLREDVQAQDVQAQYPPTEPEALSIESHPHLRNPVMIFALEGWNDGGIASTNALKRMMKTFGATRFASIDPEPYYVFSETRPLVQQQKDQQRKIIWQRNDFYYATLPGMDQDAILFLGVEPNLHWRGFVTHLLRIAQEHKAQLIISLGAFLADVLYQTPVHVNGHSNDPDLEKRLGVTRTNYEGPTGVIGVSSSLFQAHHFKTLNLWAGVPYYISVPNPKAVYALLSTLQQTLGFQMDLRSLRRDVERFDHEIDSVVSKDPNVAAYVRELKKREILN